MIALLIVKASQASTDEQASDDLRTDLLRNVQSGNERRLIIQLVNVAHAITTTLKSLLSVMKISNTILSGAA
jgi:hypothetical protein